MSFLTAQTDQGPVEVPVLFQRGGLAIHHNILWDCSLGKKFSITHTASGLAATHWLIPSMENALERLDALLELGDWTRSVEELGRDEVLKSGALSLDQLPEVDAVTP